jgi:uncharacterized membrane protein YbhN (UPF0104 family)
MNRSIWAWARVAGGVAILAVLLWRLGTGAFVDGLRVINGPALLAAFAIGVATTTLSAWRWCLVVRGLGMKLPLRTAVADYYKAIFINAALPGGVLGDVDRAVQHGRDEGDVGKSVRAVVLERTAGQVVFVTIAVTVLLTVPSPVLHHLQANARGLGLAALTAAAIAVVLVVAVGRLRTGASRWARAARTGVAEIRAGLLARRNWPGVLLASTLVLVGHLATFVVAARVAGSTTSLLRLTPLMLLALLAMVVPLNIGGWGPREGVTVWAFGAAGLSATQGLTIAVVYGLFAFVAALPGLAVIIVRAVARSRARAAAAVARPVPVLADRPALPAAGTTPIEIVVVPLPHKIALPVRELVGSSA